MEETYNPAFFIEHLSGHAVSGYFVIKLMMQVIGVLVVGMILWRIGTGFSGKKKASRSNMFNDSSFNSWKRR
ncbi:MAG: hypothetical protein ACI857_000860 [Arenicella sp.]